MGCATSQTAQKAPMQGTASTPALNQPFTPRTEIKQQNDHFAGKLPLGIGAKFDFFISDTAENAANFYNTVLRPLRAGKVFRDQAFAIDYAILPSRGDVFNHSNRTSEVTIRSDYKFRIGMTRKFYNFGDFLKADFWLSAKEKSKYAHPNGIKDQVPAFQITDEDQDESLSGGIELPVLDADDLLFESGIGETDTIPILALE
ncbi:MAG: hypothetical protein C4527_17625 [Candidatus Omnitrophota bacterium]|jgi:hypothetical protein|nr:MAG: hypothetical protein C4527_17625 [Candidatus Omnitrophota bacterium]